MFQNNYQDNVFPIWKPEMMTSSEVVRQVKNKLNLDRVGHCGTLDPFAEGIIIVVSGKETLSADKYVSTIKTYLATIVLGEKTDTLDRLGSVIYKDSNVKDYSYNQIEKVLGKFIGTIKQRPPSFSAKRINGIRLYKLARRDIFIHLKPVDITIDQIRLISVNKNKISIEVKSYKGAYIRQLANDIAKELGTVGYLESLTRTTIGKFNSENAIQLKEIHSWNDLPH